VTPDEDPIIPFRVSHANSIASAAAQIKMLIWIQGSALVLLASILGVLLMKGGG
jgi:hypothetical protein